MKNNCDIIIDLCNITNLHWDMAYNWKNIMNIYAWGISL